MAYHNHTMVYHDVVFTIITNNTLPYHTNTYA